MKIRHGFVSNSSSSSFVVDTSVLSEHQIDELLHVPTEHNEDSWCIRAENGNIVGFTIMRNCIDEHGDIEYWMKKTGYPMSSITFDND